MELTELQQRLKRLDTNKLIDVVKNYKQYGYTEMIRGYVLSLLEEQGISKQDLLLTGNLENKSYDYSNDLLNSFRRNSKLAFLFYSLLFLLMVGSPWLNPGTNSSNMVLVVVSILAIVLYFFFLLQSFLDQSRFYKSTGDELGSDGALVYLFLGMPFYIVMYFVFQNQMKERMKMVD